MSINKKFDLINKINKLSLLINSINDISFGDDIDDSNIDNLIETLDNFYILLDNIKNKENNDINSKNNSDNDDDDNDSESESENTNDYSLDIDEYPLLNNNINIKKKKIIYPTLLENNIINNEISLNNTKFIKVDVIPKHITHIKYCKYGDNCNNIICIYAHNKIQENYYKKFFYEDPCPYIVNDVIKYCQYGHKCNKYNCKFAHDEIELNKMNKLLNEWNIRRYNHWLYSITNDIGKRYTNDKIHSKIILIY